MNDLLKFENDGAIIQRTNFFESSIAQSGKMYLSWNAGVGRLLVPDQLKATLFPEIRHCNHIEIEEKNDRICLYCYDDVQPENPYLIQIEKGLTDRAGLEKGKTRIDVYIELGIKYQIDGVIV